MLPHTDLAVTEYKTVSEVAWALDPTCIYSSTLALLHNGERTGNPLDSNDMYCTQAMPEQVSQGANAVTAKLFSSNQGLSSYYQLHLEICYLLRQISNGKTKLSTLGGFL